MPATHRPKKKRAPREPLAPWLNLRQAAARVGRGRRFLLNEVKAGRLRAARIGGRQEVLTCTDWLATWVADQAAVSLVPVPLRRRG
jgi:hypothetical protein